MHTRSIYRVGAILYSVILLLSVAACAQGIGGKAGQGGKAGLGGGYVPGPQTYSVDTTGLTANVSATNVTGLSSLSAAGYYCATGYEVVTTTGAGTDFLPQINFIFTDSDSSTVETQNIANLVTGTVLTAGTANGTYNNVSGASLPMCGYANSGTAIQYSTSGCGANCGTTLVYALHVRVYGPITTNAVDSPGLTGNVSATNVSGLSSLGANGFYCARGYEVVTTAAGSSSIMPQINILFTDADTSTAQNYQISTAPSGNPGVGNTTGTFGGTPLNPFCFYAKSGTAIQYPTSEYLSSPAGMTYAVHLRVVGPFATGTGAIDTTGLTANVSTATVTGLSSISGNTYYCATSWYVITTAAGTSSTMPYATISYTDADTSTAETNYIGSVNGVNTIGAYAGTLNANIGGGSFCFYAKSGTAIQYSTNSYASSPASAMTYAFHLRVETPY
jgi:hypothetical protein